MRTFWNSSIHFQGRHNYHHHMLKYSKQPLVNQVHTLILMTLWKRKLNFRFYERSACKPYKAVNHVALSTATWKDMKSNVHGLNQPFKIICEWNVLKIHRQDLLFLIQYNLRTKIWIDNWTKLLFSRYVASYGANHNLLGNFHHVLNRRINMITELNLWRLSHNRFPRKQYLHYLWQS